jgi:hypothetical protein
LKHAADRQPSATFADIAKNKGKCPETPRSPDRPSLFFSSARTSSADRSCAFQLLGLRDDTCTISTTYFADHLKIFHSIPP